MPTALRLVSPCDTDSKRHAVSATRGSNRASEVCADDTLLQVIRMEQSKDYFE
jgi:hypothetical protein